MSELLNSRNNIDLDGINESNVVSYFKELLDIPEKKKLIIVEIAARILYLSPVTHRDTKAIESGKPDFTTIDDIVGNSLGKHRIDDLVYEKESQGHIMLKTFNTIHQTTHETSIPSKILIDILKVVIGGEESKITDKVPIHEYKRTVIELMNEILDK